MAQWQNFFQEIVSKNQRAIARTNLPWILSGVPLSFLSVLLYSLFIYKAVGMYTKAAQLYDKLYHFKDYEAHANKVVAAIAHSHPSATTLLEIACGTGRFTEHLSAHYEVQGLDINQEMLDIAARRVPGIPLHLADMVDFDLGMKFDVVACLFSSIAYARTAENFFRSILTFARHVRPGGILMIEPFFTLDSYWVDRITMNLVDEKDMKVSWMYVSELVGNEAHLNINYMVGTPAGINHFTELHRLGLFAPDHYSKAFSQSGFRLQHDPTGPAGRGLYIGTSETGNIA